MMTKVLSLDWIDSGKEAKCAPDPRFPDGIDLVEREDAERQCTIGLPYPAPRCGVWMVRCERCRWTVAITAAGRPDDPRSIAMACDPIKEASNGGK